jgi:hypothetical protein
MVPGHQIPTVVYSTKAMRIEIFTGYSKSIIIVPSKYDINGDIISVYFGDNNSGFSETHHCQSVR